MIKIDNISHEIWKDIQGYEGRYKISNTGKVKSIQRQVSNGTGLVTLPTRILKQGTSHKGYPIAYLSKNAKSKTVRIHRLVAKAFIPNPDNKPQINHIDGDKTNNNVSNLEWVTNSENQLHAYEMGLNYVTGRAGKPKRPVIQIDIETGERVKEYPSIAEAARTIGVASSSNIGQCCRGEKKTIAGYRWKYKD